MEKKTILLIFISACVVVFIASLFNKTLAVGLTYVFVFSLVSLFFISKSKVNKKLLFFLFIALLIIRIGAAFLVFYTNFHPTGGYGDDLLYHQSAIELGDYFKSGNFSIEKFYQINPQLYVSTYYPVIISILYLITTPSMLIGELFNASLAILSIIILYLIIIEVGGSQRGALVSSFIAAIYPSYLFYGTLILKESTITLFLFLATLFAIKMVKSFSWQKFLLFFIFLIPVTHLRFYTAFSVIIAFLVGWLVANNFSIKRRIIYALIFFILLGFVPQISTDQGYYGVGFLKTYLNIKSMNYYREQVFQPQGGFSSGTNLSNPAQQDVKERGTGSSYVVTTKINGPVGFVWKTIKSFIYVVLGPFPWQIKYLRQYLSLLETIPWYVLLFFVIKGVIKSAKKYKNTIILGVFIVCYFAVLSLYSSNFGIVLRLRIPAFILSFVFLTFSFNFNRLNFKKLNQMSKRNVNA